MAGIRPSKVYERTLFGIQLNGVGTTTLLTRVTWAVHVALTRSGRQRSAVGKRVSTVALLTVFNTGVLESGLSTGGGAFVDGHVGVVDSETGKGSTRDLLDTSRAGETVDDCNGSGSFGQRRVLVQLDSVRTTTG